MNSNTITDVTDPTNARKFEKHKSTGRIDGVVAMAMAMHGAELPETKEDNEPPRITVIDGGARG